MALLAQSSESPQASRCGTLVAMRRARPALRVAMPIVALIAAAAGVHAQGFRFREGSMAARYAPSHMPDANFVICRIAYRRHRVEAFG
jgi:hypothetical protein